MRDLCLRQLLVGILLCLISLWITPKILSQSYSHEDMVSGGMPTLTDIAEEIKTAVIIIDKERLLKYALPDSSDEIRAELSDRKSELYCYLFDTSCLRAIAERSKAKANPFFRRSIREFFLDKKPIKVEVLHWSSGSGSEVATVIFAKKSLKESLLKLPSNKWPWDRWAQDFVACDFILIANEWKYYGGVFKVAIDEGDIG